MKGPTLLLGSFFANEHVKRGKATAALDEILPKGILQSERQTVPPLECNIYTFIAGRLVTLFFSCEGKKGIY